MIILSVGVSFFIRYTARLIFGSKLYAFDIVSPSHIKLFGIGITNIQLTALILVAVTTVALYLFIYRTNYGEMMRGLANNEELAMVSGINPIKVSVLIWLPLLNWNPVTPTASVAVTVATTESATWFST